MHDCVYTVVRGKEGLEQISDEWWAMLPDVENPCFYQYPCWFHAHFEAYGDDGNDYFVCIRQAEQLLAIVPLSIERRSKLGANVAVLSIRHNMDVMADIIVRRNAELGDVVRKSVDALSRESGIQCDAFSCNGLATSALLQRLQPYDTFMTLRGVTGGCCEIPIIDYEQALKNLKTKFRGNLNNARRRLEKTGTAEFRVIETPAEALAAFEEYVQLEQAGWKGDRDSEKEHYSDPSAIGLSRQKHAFYRAVVEQFAANGCLEIAELRVAGKLIASQINILLGDTCFGLKTTYDETMRKYSPGHMLVDYAYRRFSAEQRIKRINLLADYPWSRGWQPETTNFVAVQKCHSTARGIGYYLLRRGRHSVLSRKDRAKS